MTHSGHLNSHQSNIFRGFVVQTVLPQRSLVPKSRYFITLVAKQRPKKKKTEKKKTAFKSLVVQEAVGTGWISHFKTQKLNNLFSQSRSSRFLYAEYR